MSKHYNEYLVNTPDIARTKEEIRDHLRNAATMLLTVSSYENGESTTRQVEFTPEAPATRFTVSQGVIQPESTQASIIEEDNKYLVLVAALDKDN